MAGYGAWLRSLGRDGVADVLRHRVDVLHEPRQPRSVHALATLLLRPHSVHRALRGEDGLTVGVAEAAVMLGSVVHRDQLTDLLDEPAESSGEDLDAALRRLQELALVWSDEPGVWHVTGGLRSVFQRPFGLGPPLHRLLADLREEDLRKLAAGVGVQPNAPVRVIRAQLEARLSDGEQVRATAAGLPAEAAGALRTLTWHDSVAGLAPSFTDDADDAWAWQQHEHVLGRLRGAGMLVRAGWEDHMPREVALALRGPGWRPAVHRRPAVVEVAASEVGVRSDAAAAASALLRDAVRLLGALDEQPAARLRSDSGGVGVREVKRLARAAGTEPRRVELLLVLLAALGLLQQGHGTVEAAPEARRWRERDPARQLVDLLTHWWSSEEGATYRPDHRTGKQQPVLGLGIHGGSQQHLRHAVLTVLAGLPQGRGTTGPDGVLEAVRWSRPLAVPPPPFLQQALAAEWWEAEAVGALGAGAASPLGRALATAGEESLLREATAVLPSVTTTAVLQSDLTALVHGVASAPLTDLLNGCADLEATGGSTRWRFTAASVRRALDAGATPEQLLDRLAAVAEHDLPQPLTYLVRDVGRRHGTLRVLSLRSAVVCADDTLLTEVLHSTPLRALHLRRLAGHVLASAKPAAETTQTLRDCGFMPVQEDAQGRVVVTGRRRDDAAGPDRRLRSALGPGLSAWGRSVRQRADTDTKELAVTVAEQVLRG